MQRLPEAYFYPLTSFLKGHNLQLESCSTGNQQKIVNFAHRNTETNLPVAQKKSWVFQWYFTSLNSSPSTLISLIHCPLSHHRKQHNHLIFTLSPLFYACSHSNNNLPAQDNSTTPLESVILVKSCPVDYLTTLP